MTVNQHGVLVSIFINLFGINNAAWKMQLGEKQVQN